MILHLNLHASNDNPIKLYGEPTKKNQQVKVKVKNGTSPVIVKILSHDSFSNEQQGEHGHNFFGDQYLTFELNIESMEVLCANVEIYVLEECIGTTTLTKTHFNEDANGRVILTLLHPKTSELSAEIRFDYLLIRSWRDEKLTGTPCKTLSTCKEEFLYMGHRGSGKTVNLNSLVLENTLPSFNAALSEGASFVELDVLLTKDEIPVVFHDHMASICADKRDSTPSSIDVQVHDLSLEELKNYKMKFARPGGSESYNADVYKTLFPTLQEVLNDTPSSLGIMIEVKYPQQERVSKIFEAKGYFDQNIVIDRILDVVMNYPGDRPIMFCSFDPECCILLQYKQHRYPVALITSGENACWPDPMDIRSRTRKFGMNFVLMYDLIGLSMFGDPLMQQDSDDLSCIVETLTKYGKHTFTWGPCNDEKSKVEYQKSLKVSGVISDHLENLSSDN